MRVNLQEIRVFSWLERQIVVLNVAGSSPVFHPQKILKDKSCKAKDLQDLFFINTIALWKTTKN